MSSKSGSRPLFLGLAVVLAFLFSKEAYVSGGGQVLILRKYYRLEALTLHKMPEPEDSDTYAEGIYRWEKASEPLFKKLATKLDSSIPESDYAKLGAVSAEEIGRWDVELPGDGSPPKDPSAKLFVLKIDVSGVADPRGSIEVEKLSIAFKIPPSKEKLVPFVARVKAIAREFQKNASH